MNYCISSPTPEIKRAGAEEVELNDLFDKDISWLYIGDLLSRSDDGILDIIKHCCKPTTRIILEDFYIINAMSATLTGQLSYEEFNQLCFAYGRKRWITLKEYRRLLTSNGFVVETEDIDNTKIVITCRIAV